MYLIMKRLWLSLQIWFKNRRAKWRKRERHLIHATTDFGKVAAAGAAAGFGSQFNSLMAPQPFGTGTTDDGLYSGYSNYNWKTAVPSSLTKGFSAWGFHSGNFNSMMSATAMTTTTTPPSSTTSSSSPSNTANTTTTTTTSAISTTPTSSTTPPTTAYPYGYGAMYGTTAGTSPSMSSSIASLRLKAKQVTSGYGATSEEPSPYSSIPLLTSSNVVDEDKAAAVEAENNNVASGAASDSTPPPPPASTSLTQCQYNIAAAAAAAAAGQDTTKAAMVQ